MNQTIGRRLRGPALSLLCFFCVIFLSAACATGHHLLVRADMAEAPAVAPIAWMSPAAEGDRAILSRWRSAVGPPVARLRASANLTSADEITVVSWNIALGAGDVERFAAALPLGNAPVVLLLQEVYRGGPDVPRGLARDASFAARLGGSAAGPDFDEVERTADKLGLSLYYVPSIDARHRQAPHVRRPAAAGPRLLSAAAGMGGGVQAGRRALRIRSQSADRENQDEVRPAWNIVSSQVSAFMSCRTR